MIADLNELEIGFQRWYEHGFASYAQALELYGALRGVTWKSWYDWAFWEDLSNDPLKTALIGGNLLVTERERGDWKLPLRCSSAEETTAAIETIEKLWASGRPELAPFTQTISAYRAIYARVERGEELVYAYN